MNLSRGVSHKEEPQDDPDQAAAPDVVDCELNKSRDGKCDLNSTDTKKVQKFYHQKSREKNTVNNQ